MRFKSNLHLHSSEDPLDGNSCDFTAKEIIDQAAEQGFDVLALTLHTACGYSPELAAYAENLGILLIPGIEQYIEGAHVLILNCDTRAEHVRTFVELEMYKSLKPDIFVVAPHPYHPGPICLHEKLEANISLFDAIEHSWFYMWLYNPNRRAAKLARRYGLPLIATSDTHKRKYLNTNYALIIAKTKTIPAIFAAIRRQQFTNVTRPAHFWTDMVYAIGIKEILGHPVRFLLGNALTKDKSRAPVSEPASAKE
ncbi:MAG: hypothetical protein COU11_03640 [Candidatus Harrisonbacteria bacterium CG10_big_fil_rev_8_21_14_0_10_49_15]|uniref:PHP domain-containing protein n=1 Tax=Candidatus Harrisonbacteria bacterium CG10_big_fil_rev_8_21_14_0_10_49_15 TaxID=1974587 RepID=A0A2H0UKI1_9BACT|nr:MAG: hypothetical protein COU11_03640 [Candidatus Harrisonbacteria bacterium CG10_big_fil_rev_8_21_14_0_10_49_15]